MQVGLLVGCDSAAIGAMELYLLGLCDWRPTQGWQEKRTAYERQGCPRY